MAFDLSKIKRGVEIKPPRLAIHGPHGVGKTTLVASAPAPFLIQLEDGEGRLDTPRHRVTGGWAELQEVLGALYNDQHDFGTVGVDSVDWLEPIIWAETCARNGWADIETPGYGKGYLAADDVWREFFAGLAALRDARGLQVILIAHSKIKRFDDPRSEPYDRYQIKLHDRAAALLQEWSDAVFFQNFKTYTQKDDVGFKKEVVRGTGFGERILYTEERPAFYAKNRYGMPPEIQLPNNPALVFSTVQAAMFPAPAAQAA